MRPRTIGLIVFVVLWTMATHGKPSSSGDEPYYLMVTQSLLADHDLDVANNFAENQGALVGADDLEAGDHALKTRSGATWSTHDIGLSILALPAYAVGTAIGARIPETTLSGFRMSRGRFAYSIVSLFMIALTSVGATLLAAALGRLASGWWPAVVTLVVVFSPPVLSHSFLVFPEVPAFFITCAVLWLSVQPAANVMFGRALAVMAAMGIAPWIHRKFSFFVIGLAFVLWHQQREWVAMQSRQRLAALAAAFVLPQVALHAVTLLAWGRLGGPQMLGWVPFSIGAIPTGTIGMLFDRSRGLIGYAPVYVLLPFAWVAAGRRFRWWLLPAALLFIPMAAFVTWDGGYSPAARFLVPMMPLLALPFVDAAQQPWFRKLAIAPLLLQIVISGYSWGHPRVLWPGEVGDNRALASVPVIGPVINRMLPVINHGTWRKQE